MPLRRRLLLLFLPLMLVSLACVWLLSQKLLLQRFDQLDAEQLAETANQLHRELHQEMSNLVTVTRDWAWWDATYRYILQGDTEYAESNLDQTTLENLGLHFILYYNAKGELHTDIWRLPEDGELIGLEQTHSQDASLLKLRTLNLLARHGLNSPPAPVKDSYAQWLGLDRLPLLVAGSAVLPGERQSAPAGTLLMGRFITHDWQKLLENRLLQRVQLEDNPKQLGDAFVLDIRTPAAISTAWLTPRKIQGDLQMTRLSLIDDQQQPNLTLRLERERPIYLQGQRVIDLFFAGVLLTLLLGSSIGYLGLEIWVIRRLLNLHHQVESVGQEEQTQRVTLPGRDELSGLASEINQMLERVEQSESRDREILDQIQDGFFELDPKGRVLAANPALERMLGYPEGALDNQNMLKALSEEDANRAKSLFREALAGDGSAILSVPLARRDGSYGHFEGRFTVIRNTQGEFLGYRGIVRDISGQVALQNRLMEMAYRDALTGLGNRKAFLEELKQAIEEADQHRRCLALLYIDLDRFKEVNDRYGHDAGDELLIRIAERMRNTLRTPDRLFRLGGDEFTLLMPGGESSSAMRLAERLLTSLHEPMLIKQQNIDFVTPSIGIALYPLHARSATELIANADSAMYQAKQQRNRACLFQADTLSPTPETR